MKNKYISVSDYVPFDGEFYTGVIDMCEPDDLPSMRTIVERHVKGIAYSGIVYDEYDDGDPLCQPGDDIFDVMTYAQEHDAYLKEKQKQTQLSPDLNVPDVTKSTDLAQIVEFEPTDT